MSDDFFNWLYLVFMVAAFGYACIKDSFSGIKKPRPRKRQSFLAYLFGAPFVFGCFWFLASVLTFGWIPNGLIGFAICIGFGTALFTVIEIERNAARKELSSPVETKGEEI